MGRARKHVHRLHAGRRIAARAELPCSRAPGWPGRRKYTESARRCAQQGARSGPSSPARGGSTQTRRGRTPASVQPRRAAAASAHFQETFSILFKAAFTRAFSIAFGLISAPYTRPHRRARYSVMEPIPAAQVHRRIHLRAGRRVRARRQAKAGQGRRGLVQAFGLPAVDLVERQRRNVQPVAAQDVLYPAAGV